MKKLRTIEVSGGDLLSRGQDLALQTRVLAFPDGIHRSFTMERVYWTWFDELGYFQRCWTDTADWLLRECPKHAPLNGRSAEEEMCQALRFLICGLHGRLQFRPVNDRKL